MSCVFDRLVVAALVTMGILCVAAQAGAAQAVSGLGLARQRHASPLIEKVHGFHCRAEYGWDPVAGVYRRHRHEGICRDYKGCLRQQRACMLLLGRGVEQWTYERFGRDNWRFTSCVMRRGCY